MYIVIIIYKNESLGYDLRVVAGPENFRPSGGGCTVRLFSLITPCTSLRSNGESHTITIPDVTRSPPLCDS